MSLNCVSWMWGSSIECEATGRGWSGGKKTLSSFKEIVIYHNSQQESQQHGRGILWVKFLHLKDRCEEKLQKWDAERQPDQRSLPVFPSLPAGRWLKPTPASHSLLWSPMKALNRRWRGILEGEWVGGARWVGVRRGVLGSGSGVVGKG